MKILNKNSEKCLLSPETYRRERKDHWDNVASIIGDYASYNQSYHQRLRDIYRFLVSEDKKVLEIGCGTGNLIGALNPSLGVGIDLSKEMLNIARKKNPGIQFIHCDAHSLPLNGTFDVIILSDIVNDLWDVQSVLGEVSRVSKSKTRIIINTYSRVWELPLRLVRGLKMAKPILTQNWLTCDDLTGLLNLADFEVIKKQHEIMFPVKLPVISNFLNKGLSKIWPFRHLDLTNFIVARKKGDRSSYKKDPVVSVIVPARNEAGNIETIIRRIPEMGGGTEIVFVEGHSSDNTFETIKSVVQKFPERRFKCFQQKGAGKGDAVRLGFEEADGDILMILDADMTVPPEDLPRFYDALVQGKGEFINGVRLMYPMEGEAMRFFNLIGNKFFSIAFSWLLGQPIKDTLCGTKVLWKEDYELIAKNRTYFGDFDPFGDFDLIFGAAKQNLKIVDLPIRYRARTYGATNINRWSHGLLLLKMVAFSARRIKFI